MAETIKVSTTMRPDDVIEVEEAEYNDLFRQNLLSKVNGKPISAKKKETE